MDDFAKRAKQLDEADPLKEVAANFQLPPDKIYLCSNSLGLPAKQSFKLMQQQMQKWSAEGAHGWFAGDDNWYNTISQQLSKYLSIILGANANEAVVMNSLTINLHLLLTSFYQPTKKRFKIIIDTPTFPSDLYAIKSHLQLHQLDPADALLTIKHPNDLPALLAAEGEATALVFLNAVNYLTGHVFDIKKMTALAHQYGCLAGFDLAHAAGNIPLALHEAQVDFAVGCTYKYLCSGPGGPGFAFIHRNHHDATLLRLSGWWGNDPVKRFQMDSELDFKPFGGAASWQVSTPSILATQPLFASLAVFCKPGMARLREKSMLQTAFLLELLDDIGIDIITPRLAEERGCQLSILAGQSAKETVNKLIAQGIICDFRSPDIIRVAPSPLYNSFSDIYQFATNIAQSVLA